MKELDLEFMNDHEKSAFEGIVALVLSFLPLCCCCQQSKLDKKKKKNDNYNRRSSTARTVAATSKHRALSVPREQEQEVETLYDKGSLLKERKREREMLSQSLVTESLFVNTRTTPKQYSSTLAQELNANRTKGRFKFTDCVKYAFDVIKGLG